MRLLLSLASCHLLLPRPAVARGVAASSVRCLSNYTPIRHSASLLLGGLGASECCVTPETRFNSAPLRPLPLLLISVIPMFQTFSSVFPGTKPLLTYVMRNYKHWAAQQV